MSPALILRRASAPVLFLLAGCAAEVPPAPPPADSGLASLVVGRERVARERVWDGVVEAVNQATLSAQTAGRVRELPFDVNDLVEAGEVVVRFTDVEQQSARRQAEAALRAARASFDEAEAEFQRISEVYERRLVSRAQFDQASARRDAARAQYEAADAALRGAGEQVDYTVVRAPYSGIVTERHVQVGETVRPGQALISGLSLDRLRLNVAVPQGDIGAIREHARAALLLADGRRIEASRVVVFPYADPATHSFSVRVELPKAETGLQPGMIAKVAFVIGETDSLRLPQEVLVQRSELSAVYVLEGGQPRLRQLRLGHRQDGRVAVLAGLVEGEQVARDPLAAGRWLEDQQQAARP